MADYDELVSVLRLLLTEKFSPKPNFTRGLLGDGQGNVEVPGRPDKSYVRFARGSTEYFEIFNRNVNPVNDWPVLIGELPWQPGLTQVVDTDWSAYEQGGWGDILGNTSPHAPTHEWSDGQPGSDPLNVHLRAIVPGRAYIQGTGTTTVFVNALEYEYNYTGTIWAGIPGIDLSPIIEVTTTGTMRYVGVYIDPLTNALNVVTGSTTVHTSAFTPPLVSFPGSVIPAARIRIYGSQTAINEADIVDARRAFTFYPKLSELWDADKEQIALSVDTTGTVSLLYGSPVNEFSTDGTLADNSDNAVPTEQAVKTYVATSSPGLSKVSSNDTTLGYLENKIQDVIGDPIAVDVANEGANENLLIQLKIDSRMTEETNPANTYWLIVEDDVAGDVYKVAINNLFRNREQARLLVNNGSGATASANDVGYIDENGDYQTTTTANDNVDWCVVVVGGANGSNIIVARRGRVSIAYTGTAPSDGDFLVTSTTAGDAQRQTTMRPEIFARCIANGSGGTVQALLLTQRNYIPLSSSNDVFRVNNSSGSTFTATINGAPSGTSVVYTVATGNEDSIKPNSASELAKIVLHNTTRGDSALIDNVDTGTNTITLTANAPAGWQNGDSITTHSQTTVIGTTEKFYDYDLSSADNTIIPELATAATIYFFITDSGGNAEMGIHPFETYSDAKHLVGNSERSEVLTPPVALIDRTFCFKHDATGSATVITLGRIIGVVVAAP